jgi:lysozyme
MWKTQAKKLIKEFEGLRLKSYKCPGGYNTIGYGHVINNATEDSLFNNGINEAEAETILLKDITLANQALMRLVRVPLNEHQRTALVSFVFNVGSGAFQASTLRQKLNRFEYELAAEQFSRWIHGGGRILPGLVRRRKAEMAVFLRKDKPIVQTQQNTIKAPSFWQQVTVYFDFARN